MKELLKMLAREIVLPAALSAISAFAARKLAPKEKSVTVSTPADTPVISAEPSRA